MNQAGASLDIDTKITEVLGDFGASLTKNAKLLTIGDLYKLSSYAQAHKDTSADEIVADFAKQTGKPLDIKDVHSFEEAFVEYHKSQPVEIVGHACCCTCTPCCTCA